MRILLGVTFLFVLATAIPTPRRGKGSRHDGIEVVEEPDRYALAKGVGFWTVAGGSLWLGQRVIRQRMRRQRIKAECIEAAVPSPGRIFPSDMVERSTADLLERDPT